jgi:hypothetical protein
MDGKESKDVTINEEDVRNRNAQAAVCILLQPLLRSCCAGYRL